MDEAKLSEGLFRSVSQQPAHGDCHMGGCVAHNKHGSGELTAPRFAVTFTAGLSGGRKCVGGVTNFQLRDADRAVGVAARGGAISLLLISETASFPHAAGPARSCFRAASAVGVA